MATSKSTRTRSGPRVRPLFAALAAAGLVAPLTPHAATIIVTDGGDAGSGSTCTLRQAVAMIDSGGGAQGTCANSSANAFGVADTVDLSGRSGVITLTGGPIQWSGEIIEFRGPIAGPATLRISGGGTSGVFGPSAGEASFLDLTIENGFTSGSGGCIQVDRVALIRSVVTGCVAQHGTSGNKYDDVALGGGVYARNFYANQSSVVGNTATDGGGGVLATYAFLINSTVANNTVTGGTCQFSDQGQSKYQCTPVMLGGGGILAGTVNMRSSTVSGNTVNATFIDYTGTGTSGSDGFIGMGGGITSVGNKYEYDAATSKAALKPVFAKARSTLMATERGRAAVAAFESKAAARTAARTAWNANRAVRAAKAGAKRGRTKVDGYQDYGLGLLASTVSGNRVVAPGNPALNAKYFGGGIAGLSVIAYYQSSNKYYRYNDEIANSTISGNSLPAVPPQTGGPPGTPLKGAAGAAWFGSPVDIWNSTITNNVGRQGAVVLTGAIGAPNAAATKSSRSGLFERMRDFSAWARSAGVATAKSARNKDFERPDWVSTIVADNASDFDVLCFGSPNCEIDGFNNLIRNPSATVVVPPDTIVGQSAQLAPLANWGGTVSGAPGHPTTGALKTHILYNGSPAIDAGTNPEFFEFDERGTGFPRVAGPAADIGAVEGSIPRPVSQPIPTLGPWALGLLSALLGALGLARRRRPTG